MSGRLQVRFPVTGFAVKGQRVTLHTRASEGGADSSIEPVRIDPTDFEIEWQDDGAKGFVGSAGVNRLDVGALVRLAAYLPFDAHTRKLLGDYAPRGQISGLTAHWKGNAEKLQTYTLKAGLHDLGVKAKGYFPGFSGISGTVDATEKGGKVALLGIPPPDTAIDWNQVIFKGLEIKGIYGREMFETWYKMVALIQSGLDISPIITHHFPIDDFEKGFATMLSGQSGKVILEW